MVRLGMEIRYWTNYILGKDCNIFRNKSVRDPRKKSDHYIILGFLQIATLREYTKYLGQLTRPPLQTPAALTREDEILRPCGGQY